MCMCSFHENGLSRESEEHPCDPPSIDARAATFALSKAVARELTGRVSYSKAKGIEPERYEATVRQFVAHHGSITPAECRELLGFGDSQSARVQVSKYLTRWSSQEGFLKRTGISPRTVYISADAVTGGSEGI